MPLEAVAEIECDKEDEVDRIVREIESMTYKSTSRKPVKMDINDI